MARFLQQILASNEPDFTIGLQRLESSVPAHNIDTRTIADITHRAHDVLRFLGLDTADSTGHEVYRALVARASDEKLHNLLLDADYVLFAYDDGVVSFNLIDVIENAHHELPYETRTLGHGQRSLRGELFMRYLQSSLLPENEVRAVASDAGLLVESDEGYSRLEQVADAHAPSVLAIGDIFTDAFIELDPNEAISFTDEKNQSHLMMPFGSKPPYLNAEVVTSVGPSPNAAVSFARLGLKVGLRSFLGDDQTGNESIAYLKKEGIATDLLSQQAGMRSNYYYVLRLGADRTILVKNEKFTYTWQDPAQAPAWIYLSLISADSWQLHEDLLAYLEKNPEIKFAFQPGTFHFKWGIEKLAGLYKRSYIVVMNREEAVDVTGGSYDDVPGLARALHELGPEVVVITDGPNGSYASYDGKLVSIANYPDPAPPLDRTGAGDAFASTIVAALAQGESVETALAWAPINSMSVVQKLGAQAGLLHKEDILHYLQQAPEDYRVKEYTA